MVERVRAIRSELNYLPWRITGSPSDQRPEILDEELADDYTETIDIRSVINDNLSNPYGSGEAGSRCAIEITGCFSTWEGNSSLYASVPIFSMIGYGPASHRADIYHYP